VSDCVWLLRHGDTAWTEQGKHTGLKDLPLSDKGRADGRRAGRVLAGVRFAFVLVSPQRRAIETAQFAGLETDGHHCAALVEWDYGGSPRECLRRG
jgi:probable phosphoglycerate mutase